MRMEVLCTAFGPQRELCRAQMNKVMLLQSTAPAGLGTAAALQWQVHQPVLCSAWMLATTTSSVAVCAAEASWPQAEPCMRIWTVRKYSHPLEDSQRPFGTCMACLGHGSGVSGLSRMLGSTGKRTRAGRQGGGCTAPCRCSWCRERRSSSGH